jgi:hypothetical protein
MTWDLMPTSAAEVEIWLTDLRTPAMPVSLPEIASAGAWYQVPIHFVCFGLARVAELKMNDNCPIP